MHKRNTWVARVKQAEEVMCSVDGAHFQEYALANLDYVHSEAHGAIGRLVRAINNGHIPVDVAKMIFAGLLSEAY